MENVPKLVYWIQEREKIRKLKEGGAEKPWSSDWVFQQTYFCNVHREDDKVTRYIRQNYTLANHDMFEWNIVLARFINRISSLDKIGFQDDFCRPDELKATLHEIASEGKLWGNAYIITTHGQKMGKIDYLVDQVLTDVYEAQKHWFTKRSCQFYHTLYSQINGIGSFLAAQIVADLKNTKHHILNSAHDKQTFCAPGPGSLRGLGWIFGKTAVWQFDQRIEDLYAEVSNGQIPLMCMQDFQNCLCEFDKYMRVSTGSGRSKRKYNGS